MYRCPICNSKNVKQRENSKGPSSHRCRRCHYIGDRDDFDTDSYIRKFRWEDPETRLRPECEAVQ